MSFAVGHSVNASSQLRQSPSLWDLESDGWHFESRDRLQTLEWANPMARFDAVAITPDSRRAVGGPSWEDVRLGSGQTSLQGHFKVWDLESGRVLQTLQGHTGQINTLAVTPDGRRAISGSSTDPTLKVWNLESGCVVQALEGHAGQINAVVVAPDGRRAVSASADKTLKVWDLETGCTVRTLKGHTGYVMTVALTADGQRVVSGSEDHTLKVWDLKNDAAIATFTCDVAVTCCAVSSGGIIVAGDDAGLVHMLILEE